MWSKCGRALVLTSATPGPLHVSEQRGLLTCSIVITWESWWKNNERYVRMCERLLNGGEISRSEAHLHTPKTACISHLCLLCVWMRRQHQGSMCIANVIPSHQMARCLFIYLFFKKAQILFYSSTSLILPPPVLSLLTLSHTSSWFYRLFMLCFLFVVFVGQRAEQKIWCCTNSMIESQIRFPGWGVTGLSK